MQCRKYAHRMYEAPVATKILHATPAAHHHLDGQAHRTFIASPIAGRDPICQQASTAEQADAQVTGVQRPRLGSHSCGCTL